jgi:hypothetical protein
MDRHGRSKMSSGRDDTAHRPRRMRQTSALEWARIAARICPLSSRTIASNLRVRCSDVDSCRQLYFLQPTRASEFVAALEGFADANTSQGALKS